MNNTKIIFFAFCILRALSLKILSIKDVEKGKQFNITIKSPPLLKTSEFSFCWWMKFSHRGFHWYLGNGNKDSNTIQITDMGIDNGIWVNDIWDINFPGKVRILPHTWTFFCLICDKNKRTIEFYLNSIRIYKEEMPILFDGILWETEFLRNNIMFNGEKSPHNITGLNLWSGSLKQEDINSLYNCQQDHSTADIMTWDDVEFDISPETDKIQMFETEDEIEPCKQQINRILVRSSNTCWNGKQERSIKKMFCSWRKDGCVIG